MDWAQKRKLSVILILAAIVIAAAAVLAFAVFYETPTCFDQKQNGGETGIDCGGSCSTVCSAQAQPARVVFARALPQSGRTDLIAYLENPNADAYARDAEVVIDVYGQDGSRIQKRARITLPAHSSTPLFLPGISSGPVQQVFVSFEGGAPVWMRGAGWEQPAPSTGNLVISDASARPRVTATIGNATAYVERDVPLVATVFAADGSVIAASQTVVPMLPPQGSAQAVFTWNEPFLQAAARVEVVPLIALPRLVP